ncbi:hypothetical protein T4A_14474, partial [Trichinella pseudospiralis]
MEQRKSENADEMKQIMDVTMQIKRGKEFVKCEIFFAVKLHYLLFSMLRLDTLKRVLTKSIFCYGAFCP